MRDITPPEIAVASATTIQRAQGSLLVHATECMTGGPLDFLRLATRELAQLGVRQTLVYTRRAETPADVATLFPPTVRMVEVAPAQGTHLAFMRSFAGTLRELVREQPVSAVHLHSSKAGFVGRLALAFGRGNTRLIYSPHGLSYVNRRRRDAALVYWALECLAGVVDCVPVGCSESEAYALARLTGRPAHLLENCVDASWFDVVSEASDEVPVVLTCGRIWEQKNPECFAELAVRTFVDLPHARFVWVGDGDPGAVAMLRAAGVQVTGWVDGEEVRRWMARASVYVQASRWEGMPMAVLQALAAGLPCVVTDVPGNRDAVVDGETGFVVQGIDELAAHVELLLREPAVRQAMQGPARAAAARRFGRARFREALIGLYGLRAVPDRSEATAPLAVGIASSVPERAALDR
jgi:glycosyltransferase involved in cell wall biosynthesis